MGLNSLLGVSDPDVVNVTHDKDPFYLQIQYVVVAVTESETIKFYYTNTDNPAKLKTLLSDNGVADNTSKILLSTAEFDTANDGPSELANKLPGVELKTKHPVNNNEDTVRNIIISLNDTHKWSRESIADWLENTFDIEQIAFGSEVTHEKRTLSEFTKVVKIKRIL